MQKTKREILFRGKRLDDGQWVEGSFEKRKEFDFKTETYVYVYRISRVEICAGVYFLEDDKVDPGTIGQFTDKLDKNGKRIFEGDVVKFYDKGYARSGIATVDFENGAWKINGQYTSSDFKPMVWFNLYSNDLEYEVLGNIHDNPELLEVKDAQNIK